MRNNLSRAFRSKYSPTRHGEPPVVVVTGASAGVGRATARAFGAEGARVGLVARGLQGLEAAKREIEAAGGQALVVPTDVADEEAVERAAVLVEDAFGGIDVWVNNAMVTVFSPVKRTTAAEFRRVTEVSYLGYVYGTLAALRRMLPKDRGSIVQVSSALAFRSIPLQAPYCASKHAVLGFTEALRSELIHDDSNVRLSMVHLPGMNTPQFSWSRAKMPRKPQPLPPIYQPEVAARAILWAAFHARRDVTVGWPTQKTILGGKLVPGLLDWYLAYKAWDGQLTDEPLASDRPDNLLEARPGDFGARGDYSRGAKDRSWLFEASARRRSLWLGGLAVAALGYGAYRFLRANGEHRDTERGLSAHRRALSQAPGTSTDEPAAPRTWGEA
jgi:NAD(P)-dependent dehydrogenase (short-subunit alcohol dehydrogenase family)